MQQFVTDYISRLSGQFYIFQVIVIMLLVVYGVLFMLLIRGENLSVLDMILAYPVSLVIFSLSGYFLLSFGIPFNKYSVIGPMLALVVVLSGVGYKKLLRVRITKQVIIYAGVMIVLALIATSGIISVSVTNDSLYFFSEYPRALVNYGNINPQLDNFLTDASQGIAVIGTIPFLYGFDEIFGIQIMLNWSFVAFFACAIYELSRKAFNDNRLCTFLASLAVIMLISSMPYVLMSKWFMANMFFMEYMTIFVYLAYKYAGDYGDLIILSVLLTGLSIMRMEGALNAGVLVLCIMMLNYKSRDIVEYLIVPMLILQSMYLFRIFKLMTLHTGIQFMTEQKALILIGFLMAIVFYAIVIRDRLTERIVTLYPYGLIGGLVLVNVAVFIYDRRDYSTNIKAFVLNVLRNNGWGLFVSFIIGVFILIPRKSLKINYFDITAVCYILLTIVAGWARGDNLCESFGDSGNRILIQVVPLILMALMVKVIDGISYLRRENLINNSNSEDR